MAHPIKLMIKMPKKPPTANSSFQQEKPHWPWEKLYKDFKSENTKQCSNWLGKYNPFFIFHHTVFPN